ncbi:MAG: hypothetical protein ACRD8U_17550 [Pyrinomonadaceae bacterium]
MTKWTFSNTVISFNGSPRTAIRSANLPVSIEPNKARLPASKLLDSLPGQANELLPVYGATNYKALLFQA